MSRRLEATSWARAAMGQALIEATRTRLPLGWELFVAGQSARGPWRVTLVHDHRPVYDEWHKDLEGTIGAALALIPSDLEAQLRASLDARGLTA